MSVCRDTIFEWYTPSRKIVYIKNLSQFFLWIIQTMEVIMLWDSKTFQFEFMMEKIKLGGHDNHKVTGHMSKIYAIKKEEQKESTQLYCCKFSNDFGKYIFFGGSQVNSVKVFDWSGKGLASIDQLSHACCA